MNQAALLDDPPWERRLRGKGPKGLQRYEDGDWRPAPDRLRRCQYDIQVPMIATSLNHHNVSSRGPADARGLPICKVMRHFAPHNLRWLIAGCCMASKVLISMLVLINMLCKSLTRLPAAHAARWGIAHVGHRISPPHRQTKLKFFEPNDLQAWLALSNLLMEPATRGRYDLDGPRTASLTRLRRLLHEVGPQD